MSELQIIFVREFMARVRTRAFLISTLLVPILLAAAMLLPRIVGSGAERQLVIVNEASEQIGRAFAAELRTPPASAQSNSYRVELMQTRADSVREELNQRVLRNQIEGYVVVPADVLQGASVEYHARSISSPLVNSEIARAASRATQAERLNRLGISPAELQSLIRSVTVNGIRVSKSGEQQGSSMAAFFVAYAVAFATYMLTLLYGVNLLRSVLEEKTQRVAEVILSTARPGYFLAGKVLGAAAAALLQLAIWVAAAAMIVGPGGIGARLGVPSSTLAMLAIEPQLGVSMLMFFILGFLLYASLFAAMGAAVGSEQEAQSMQTLVIMPLVLPLLFMRMLTNDPSGSVSVLLSLFPFTSPVAMSMRLAAAPVPMIQVVLSIGLLTLGLVATLWVAGRIFRIGLLSTGAKPNLQELWRWLKAA